MRKWKAPSHFLSSEHLPVYSVRQAASHVYSPLVKYTLECFLVSCNSHLVKDFTHFDVSVAIPLNLVTRFIAVRSTDKISIPSASIVSITSRLEIHRPQKYSISNVSRQLLAKRRFKTGRPQVCPIPWRLFLQLCDGGNARFRHHHPPRSSSIYR